MIIPFKYANEKVWGYLRGKVAFNSLNDEEKKIYGEYSS